MGNVALNDQPHYVTSFIALEILSLKQQNNQLTAEENQDCCSLHETLLQNEKNDGSWQSFIESLGEKK